MLDLAQQHLLVCAVATVVWNTDIVHSLQHCILHPKHLLLTIAILSQVHA